MSTQVLGKWTISLVGVVVCGLLLLARDARAITEYEYDALGRLTRVTYDNGSSISYEYDPAGNVTTSTTG